MKRAEILQNWPTTPAEAIPMQQKLRQLVSLKDETDAVKFIAGVDVSHKDEMSQCAIVVLETKTMTVVEQLTAVRPMTFPYVPGFLSFRELPVVFDALDKLQQRPDLLMVDGQGIAHPRRLGIASHLGVLIDLPTIGVAKSRLCGTHAEPGPLKGDFTPLMDKNERIGEVLRSKENCLPLYISPGHRIGFDTALNWVTRTLTKYRLPEPTRLADKLSKINPKIKTPAEPTIPRQRSML